MMNDRILDPYIFTIFDGRVRGGIEGTGFEAQRECWGGVGLVFGMRWGWLKSLMAGGRCVGRRVGVLRWRGHV